MIAALIFDVVNICTRAHTSFSLDAKLFEFQTNMCRSYVFIKFGVRIDHVSITS